VNRTLIPVLLALLASCTSPDRYKVAVVGREPYELARIAGFKKQYLRYSVPNEAKPAFDHTELNKVQKRQTLRKTGALTLDLQLGQRWKSPSGYRTLSRYRLRDIHGRVIASAESMFSPGELADATDNFIRIFHDPVTQSLLVYEEVNWCAGRHILFQPSLTGHGWIVRYLELPHRDSMNPTLRRYIAQGIFDSRVYFFADDQLYAMPVDEVEEEKDLAVIFEGEKFE